MRLDGLPEDSGSIEDRRGMGGKLAVGGGIGAIIVTIIGLVLGVDLNKFVGPGGPQPGENQKAPDDGYREFAGKIIGTTNEVWKEEFRKNGYGEYQKPHMVLFSEEVQTKGCGNAPSAVGPFYCPADKTVYLDPTFFDELEQKFGGSKAEFSQAYVIAHEVGHHVQNLLRYSHKADSQRGRGGKEKEYSVRLELQADYLAGVWAHHADKKYHILESGDVEEAIKTALSIGDNRIQKKARGWVSPESYTHGTDRQRAAMFKNGLKTGDASEKKLDLFFNERLTPLRSNGELDDKTILSK